ncbi:response regulator [Pseudoalteromonas sp. T1lg23B]|uniref:response regulator n=1 Tax=Pseudoalteromonas sp. T1lg23B TaxID=2077097 RepID=UPI000CF65243|nr:response regulator transcription factor [Pseudoalteromonas sp. T1lg23B]
MKNVRIFVADDHKIFKQGLISLIESKPELHLDGEASDGETALRLILEQCPDVAILDISMPMLNGIELTRRLKQRQLSCKVLILSMHYDVRVVDRALSAGADGYIVKDAAFEELTLGINCVLKKKCFLNSQIQQELDTYRANSPEQQLTEREKEIVRLIANGYANKEIGERLHISHKTVDAHRVKIMRKLNLHKSVELARYAFDEKLDI